VRISIDTGEKLPLSTPESDDNDPAISPDGRTLAFVRTTASAAHNIYLMPATGGRPRPLTSGNYDTIGLAWMDSQRIVAATTRGQGPRNLWVFPASGGSPARLTDSLSALKFPTASSGRLVYSMARDDFHIWRAEHDGENVWITSSGLDSSPQYSSTGRIAFRSSRTGSNEIWVCDGDGSNPRRITDLGGLVGSPSWSPDRTRIAFDSTRSGNSDIYLADPAGDMPPRRLTAEATNEVMPSWSPDGRFLYYGSNRTGRWRVWRIPAEGPGEPEAVTPEAGARGIPLPDGKYLATHDTAPGETTASIFLFRVTPPGTSYPSTSPSPSERLIEGLEPDLWGAWTVGAEGIYFLQKDDLASPRAKESGYSVRLFDPLTRRTRSLFRLAGTPLKGDLGITVSPDGRFVLYTRRESDSSTLVLLERSQ
jgi:Tol biopolymer transport system component